MTHRNDEPHTAMRPLDKTRDGFLLGEGSGFVILEELSHALARGAKIYAEIGGHGRSCEAYHSVSPHPEGIGARRAMEKALHMAQMHPSEINYINIHGTATASSDIVEMRAIKQLFNGNTMKVAVSGTKPVTGHLLAAAGAIETIVCALTIKHSQIPYTLNLNDPEKDCEGDLVMGHSRAYPVRTVMNLNSGFGGKNSCLILKDYPGMT
jgi:3-oxoacyl-[acyl-carrier-protein] synthase II